MTNPNDNNNIKLAVIQNDISYIKQEVSEIKNLITDKYVTLEMFEPVRRIVYGIVGIVLMAVIGALIALVVNN